MTKPDIGKRVDERALPWAGTRLLRVLAWLAPAHRRDEFVGDLIEEAGEINQRRGRWRAFWWLCGQALTSLPAVAVWRFRARRSPARLPAQSAAVVALSTAEVGHAFEAFLVNGAGRARRPGALLLSAAFHGGLILFSVGWTLMRVDEVDEPKPPPLAISRLLFQPPNAAAPPGGPTVIATRKPARKLLPVATKPRPPVAIVPPRPSTAPVDNVSTSGDPGTPPAGDKSAPGRDSGDACPPGAACDSQASGAGAILPPTIAEKQCLDCPPPRLPPALARLSARQVIETKLCVDVAGRVSSCEIKRGIDATADAQVCETIRSWRLAPFKINQHAVPFCYDMRFVFVND